MEYVNNIVNALTEEHASLSTLPTSALLTAGQRIPTRSGRNYYRFEIPDNFYLSPGMTVHCSIGTATRYSFPVIVADVQSQFVYFLFPCAMGEQIPEIACRWDPAEIVARLRERWGSMKSSPLLEQLTSKTFAKNEHPYAKEPIFPSSFNESQLAALKSSLARTLSFIIGERRHGKTGVAAALLFNALREGKRILYLASSSNGLYDCMNEVASLNPVVAEESIAIIDAGLDLQPALPVPHLSLDGVVDPQRMDGLKKLFSMIAAEVDYARVDELAAKIVQKQKQIAEAIAEAESAKEEATRLQNLGMMERMKLRNHKALLDEAQMKTQHKIALVERLNKQIITLTKEQTKREHALPVPTRERKNILALASTAISFTGTETVKKQTEGKRCVATTLSQALLLDASLVSGFDVVCMDDAHALNLPQFLYCASLASERCYILADVTEQPPQSVSQGEQARTWLQTNYFGYLQHDQGDEHRFSVQMMPKEIVSELQIPGRTPTLFEALLFNVLEGTPIPPSTGGHVFFVNTDGQFATSPQYVGKKKILPHNEISAQRVIDCVKHALLNGATMQSDIMIVAPPSGQTLYLREHLHAHRMNDIEIATLGSLRLCSKRAVIVDMTVAGLDFTLRILDERKSGLVKVADTFNTLLSTVQDDLYIVADLGYFKSRYKGKFIEKLLTAMNARTENIAGISTAMRRFDDLPIDVRKNVLSFTSEEKRSPEYRTAIERAKLSAVAGTSAPQTSIAQAEKKLLLDVYAASLRVLAMRSQINIIAQYLETAPLYKTTMETLKYFSALPEYDCEDENDFKAIMDMWNVLIYETSETSSARPSQHPLAVKAKVESKIASDIQQIYFYYNSDLEMVVEEGKHKLAQSIQKIFHDCIGKKPVTPADWKNAYLIFLNRMEKYLDTIVNQIRV